MENTHNMVQILKSMGIDPNTLSREKMNVLLQLAEKINDPTNMDPNFAHNILKNLGVKIPGQNKNTITSTKIGVNEKCLCGSGLKYKKCCLKK